MFGVPAVNSSSVYWIFTVLFKSQLVHDFCGAWYKNNRDSWAHVMSGWSSKMRAVLGLCLNSLLMVCFMAKKQFILFGAHVICLYTWSPQNIQVVYSVNMNSSLDMAVVRVPPSIARIFSLNFQGLKSLSSFVSALSEDVEVQYSQVPLMGWWVLDFFAICD